jgi:HEAT repeats
MAVTMKDVRAALDPEEPKYDEAAKKLGADAIPHLRKLVQSEDTMIASKATYLASLIKDAKSADVVQAAAASDDPAVRVAAAAATANLGSSGASPILETLVGDSDPGVRKVARTAVPSKPSAALSKVLEDAGDEGLAGGDAELLLESQGEPLTIGLMPGEVSGDDPGNGQATMPGEGPGGMPGEQSKMPGES